MNDMSQIAINYAQALYSLGAEEAVSDTILRQLTALDAGFSQEPDFLKLLSAPNVSKEERCNILDQSFLGKVHPYVLNFLKLLTEKGHIGHFSHCCKQYRKQYNADHGILSVRAVTAVALTDAQRERLTQKLAAITGKTIDLTVRVDPTVLGGVRLDYDGKRVDGTLQNRLDAIGNMLKNTVL